eukprot:850612-Pyramimonas_sp.AAC.1
MSSKEGIAACSTQQADIRRHAEEEDEEAEPEWTLAIGSTDRPRIYFQIGHRPELEKVPDPRARTVVIYRVQVLLRRRRSTPKEAPSGLTVESRTRVERRCEQAQRGSAKIHRCVFHNALHIQAEVRNHRGTRLREEILSTSEKDRLGLLRGGVHADKSVQLGLKCLTHDVK